MKRLLLIFALLCPTLAHAQLWSGIIDPSRAIDWTSAGFGAGTALPEPTSQCGSTIAALGTLASPGDIDSAIQAIAPSCTAGQYILLGPGNFYTHTPLEMFVGGACNSALGSPSVCWANKLQLRGSGTQGANQTTIYAVNTPNGGYNASFVPLTGGNNSVVMVQNACDWTAGYAKGATVINLSNCGSTTPAAGMLSNLKPPSGGNPGSIISLDQVDVLNDNGTIWPCALNGYCANHGTGGFTRNNGPCLNSGANCWRSQVQIVEVTAITTTGTLGGLSCSPTVPCVTITPGLYMPNWASGQLPQATWGAYAWQQSIENLVIDYRYSTGVGNGTSMMNCYQCWIKDVVSLYAPRNHLQMSYGVKNSVITDNYIYQNSGTAAGTGAMTASGCTLTQSGGSPFTSYMTEPGLNTLFISGAGVSGGWLTTTVTGYTDSSHVTVSPCASTTVSGATVNGTYFQHASVSYGIELEQASDNLVQNNICQFTTDGCNNSDGQVEGNVTFANFGINGIYYQPGFMEAMYYSHAVDQMELKELLIGNGQNIDNIHGTHAFISDFRDFLPGNQPNCGGIPCNAQTQAINLNAGARYINMIGGVYGDSTIHTVYKCTATSTSPCNGGNGVPVELIFGYTGLGGGYQSGYQYCQTPACSATVSYDQQVNTYSMLWANWDAVTNTVRFCGNSSDTGWSTTCGSTSEIPTSLAFYSNPVPTLGDTGAGQGAMPASFYYSSKPSWWGSIAWPAIGPDVTGGTVGRCTSGTYNGAYALSSGQCGGGSFTASIDGGHVNATPAMTCYLNGMSGNPDGSGGPYTFNPSTCYNSTPLVAPCPQCFAQQPPAPPADLRVVRVN